VNLKIEEPAGGRAPGKKSSFDREGLEELKL
jgi:hypothetical protein